MSPFKVSSKEPKDFFNQKDLEKYMEQIAIR